MSKLRSHTKIGIAILIPGAALAGCSLLLGGDKNYIDLDATSSSSGESASSAGGTMSSTVTSASAGGSGGGATSGQTTGAGGCPAQGGCGGGAASSSAAASSSVASSSASSGTGGAIPCGAGGIDALTDTFTGNVLDVAKWGAYTDGMGSTAAVSNNQLVVFDIGGAGTNAGLYSQAGYSLKGCSASIKVLDAPKIVGMSSFFLLNAKADIANELSFNQSGIYLNMEIHDTNGLKAAKQIMFTKGVQVYWRFRETPDAGGTIHWETSSNGVAWTEQFTYLTASLGFSITQLAVNIGMSASGAPSTTVHYDNFNVVP